jgi:putative DNA primase/helicase
VTAARFDRVDDDPFAQVVTLPTGRQEPVAAADLRHTRARYPETDVGNASRFAIDHGPRGLEQGAVLHHVYGLGWLEWDQRRWRSDDDGAVDRAAVETVRQIKAEAQGMPDGTDDEREAQRRRFAWGLRSQAAPRIDALLRLARSDKRLVVRAEQLDADPWLLCVGNGTLDLDRGQLREHRRDDLLTKLAATAYDPAATAPRWQQFLAETFGGDEDLIAYVQRAVGYSLTAEVREQSAFILHGDGANGKTTFLQTLAHVLGDYAVAADTTSFTTAASDRAARTDLVRLRGARLVVSDEIEQGAYLAEALIKRITGGDRVVARHMYREEIEFVFTGKLWLAVNHLPTITGQDHAIWRRLKVIPCTARPTRLDKQLPTKLRAEAAGILAWAVEGCNQWRRHGLGRCVAVDGAASSYQREQDRVGEFLDECCDPDAHGRVSNAELTEAYTRWETNHGRRPLTDFTRRIKTRPGIGADKSNGVRYTTGIALRGTVRDSDSDSLPPRTHVEVSERPSLTVPAGSDRGQADRG